MVPALPTLQALVIQKGLDLLLGFVSDQKNIETARKIVKEQVTLLVKDTQTKWDDEAAKIIFKFFGMDGDK